MFDRQYLREFLIWLPIWLATCLIGFAMQDRLPEGDLRRLWLIVPVGIIVVMGCWIELRQLRRFDERQRQIYLEACFVAMIAAMGSAVLLVVLDGFTGPAKLGPVWVIAGMAVGFLVGWARARRRYG